MQVTRCPHEGSMVYLIGDTKIFKEWFVTLNATPKDLDLIWMQKNMTTIRNQLYQNMAVRSSHHAILHKLRFVSYHSIFWYKQFYINCVNIVIEHVFPFIQVVPNNAYPSKKNMSHSNIEIVSTSQAVKYLYKYVYNGNDRSQVRKEYSNPTNELIQPQFMCNK